MGGLLSRFASVVRAHPEQAAVWSGPASLTFAELDARASGLAAALRCGGVRAGDRVGVHLARGVDLVVAFLACWRAGAAYVPLDPAYPAARLAAMAAGAAVRALVCAGEPPGWARGTVVVAPDAAAENPAPETPEDPGSAYVIFTSGSTGVPNGVEVGCAEVASLIEALETAGVYPSEPRTVAWNTSMSFDASVQQWVRVCRGDTIVVLTEEDRFDPPRLRALLDSRQVREIDLTPTHWTVLREALLPPAPDGRVLQLNMGGEPIPPATWGEIAASPSVDGVSMYGPTEAVVTAMTAWITGDRPHLGAALPGAVVHLLDDELRPAQAGEIYLGGSRLAVGYVGDPDLTARRFLRAPDGGRVYRTGDLAERTADGLLQYRGRADRQLKWRGIRLEPGEIESHLTAHPQIRAAAVLLRDDRLVALLVTADGTRPATADLVAHLLARLPEALLPSRFEVIDRLPMSVAGKTDYAALLVEDRRRSSGRGSTVPVRTPAEP